MWTVPVASALSFPMLALAAFSLCGVGCYSPQYVAYDEIPFAIFLCAGGGLLLLLAVQLVPWARSAWVRLLAAIPAGALWGGGWLLFGLRAFDPMSPLFGR
ncbi:hypothetical protein [Microbacterium rhizophilus]|uniref:hypothetical protein n=1 Tax=Microbacterium rhizophilus TaxID=3138934 RepID=UPI0031E4EC06